MSKPDYTCGAHVRGYWQPMTYGPKLGPKFVSSFDAGKWANKHFGVGYWTLRWVKKSEETTTTIKPAIVSPAVKRS